MRDVKKLGDQRFEKRLSLMSLWQEIADNFYPERADFTVSRSLGTDFAAHLTTNYPILARRELGNALSSMLRPRDGWFDVTVRRDDRLDHEGRMWLENATTVQRRVMADRRTRFVRATKEGDHDFAAFGQCVLSVEMNPEADGLLYRSWHLRDCAWGEDSNGNVSDFHAKWKPTASTLVKMFDRPGRSVHDEVKRIAKEKPETEIECRRVQMPAEDYDKKKFNTRFVLITLDCQNDHEMEVVGINHRQFNVPRWQTVSGSQYAFSPATVAALPDARLIQAMTLSLLEAGEFAVNPPMVATQRAVRSDINLQAAGITWVDPEYDEKLGQALRPLTRDPSGLPYGMEARDDIREMIAQAFFLNKLQLPAPGQDMTAYEVGQRIQEYIRQALPLFEPIEDEYNGPLCEETFQLLFPTGVFGPRQAIPESLQGQDIEFRFESPLREATDAKTARTFLEASELLGVGAQIDPAAPMMVDAREALRDALHGAGVPEKWVRGEEEMQAVDQQMQEQREAAAAQEAIKSGVETAKTASEAMS